MSDRAYVVHRRAYDTYGTTVGRSEGSDSISLVPLRAFATRAAADAHTAESMRLARRTMNPFAAFYYYSGAARVEALEVGFRVKPSDKWGDAEWGPWYEAEAPHLTDAQREKVWSLFAAEPLYGVTEVPMGDE